jgi:hypothetical protein
MTVLPESHALSYGNQLFGAHFVPRKEDCVYKPCLLALRLLQKTYEFHPRHRPKRLVDTPAY